MSKPAHTPGPWRVGAYGTTVMTGRPNSQANDTICSLYMPIHSGVGELLLPQDARTEQVEANARLIAAAPDILAALQRLRDDVQAMHVGSERCNDCAVCLSLKLADAALSKV